jgi:hypothetical protein
MTESRHYCGNSATIRNNVYHEGLFYGSSRIRIDPRSGTALGWNPCSTAGKVANASVAGVGITGVMIGVRCPNETVAAFAIRIPGNLPVWSFMAPIKRAVGNVGLIGSIDAGGAWAGRIAVGVGRCDAQRDDRGCDH